MSHDPQAWAAAFLADEMPAEQRRDFEEHLLGCDRCWAEVEDARRGRALLEGLRTAAPAALRDRVRAVVDLQEDEDRGPRRPSRSRRVLAAAALLVVAGSGLGVSRLLTRGEPMEQTVVATYQHPARWALDRVRPPARNLAGLHWVGSRSGRIHGEPVVAQTYRGDEGSRVVVMLSDAMVPAPGDARPVPHGAWQVHVGGVTVFCTQRPHPALVVGSNRPAVLRAAAALVRAEG